MIILTYKQKTFLLKAFFEHDGYPGWRNIATKLLDTGSCIVPGKTCIWRNGLIANFIETKESEIAVDCLEYSFDLKNFLSSKWFNEVYLHEIDKLNFEKLQAENKVATVISTIKEIDDLSSMGEI